ncbi:hypothetical protein EVC30_014 [Rhizobium phage RHph_Y1_11]|nr:hypothetical protein EVC30_014 [Rhizobium phage RHph_Y1_11]
MESKAKTVFDQIRKKSWKREVAAGMLAVLLYFVWYVIAADDIALMESRRKVLELLIYPIFLFAAGAYGMQSFTDQYLPNKARSDRLKELPPTFNELATLTPPTMDPAGDVPVTADELKKRGL